MYPGDDTSSIPMTRSSVQGKSIEQPCYLDEGKMGFENHFSVGVQGLPQIVGSRSWILKEKAQEKSSPGSTFISCLVLDPLWVQLKTSLLYSKASHFYGNCCVFQASVSLWILSWTNIETDCYVSSVTSAHVNLLKLLK